MTGIGEAHYGSRLASKPLQGREQLGVGVELRFRLVTRLADSASGHQHDGNGEIDA